MNNKGFTLIELLISITLLSLIMFTGNYVYSQLASRWNKELGDFDQHLNDAKSVNRLQQLLQGIEPYIVQTAQQKQVFFFIGAEQSLLASTKRGIISDSRPEVFRITAVKNPSDKYDLVYQSISSAQMLLKRSDQEINFTHEMVLLHDLDDVKFTYFGWPSLEAKASRLPGIAALWYSSYSGINNLLTPEKIKLTLVKNGKAMSLVAPFDIEANNWLRHYVEVGF